jgi:hypothetical protein
MLRPNKIPRGPQAFTLLEVMMAATVLLLAIMGMIQVVISGSEMLDFSRKQTIATQIIHDQIDRLHVASWTGSGGVSSYPLSPTKTTMTISPTLQTAATGFVCKREVWSVKSDGTLRKIIFTVTWTGNTGRAYSRQGTTYFGKNGLNVTFQRS